VVARAFSDYIAALPDKNITAADSKRFLEYEAVRDTAWDAAYVAAPGVARPIYNALRGVAGSRMLTQAERDMMALQPEAAGTPWSSGGGRRQRGSGGGSSNSSSQNQSDNRPKTVNSVKACYGCGDKGHIRRDCPKNKHS
jgi:hypothetical protein